MKIIPLVVALSMLAITANANFSISYRYLWFEPAGEFGDENPKVDGVALVRFNIQSGTTGMMTIRGLLPNQTYGVKIGEAHVNPNAFFTNSSGVGHYSIQFGGMPHPEDPAILIFIFDGCFDTVWDVSDQELRASGAPL